MKYHTPKQLGFTIIELLIATAVFSTILLLCTYGLLQIGRVYLKGLTLSRTQEVSRNALAEVSQAIQYSGSSVNPPNVTPAGAGVRVVFCVGNVRYTFVTDRQLTDRTPAGDQTTQGFIKDEPNSCDPTAPVQPAFVNPKELLGVNMRLMNFSVTKVGATDSYRVSIRVVFGDTTLLTPDHLNCRAGNSAGGGFCAVSELTTTVQQRVK